MATVVVCNYSIISQRYCVLSFRLFYKAKKLWFLKIEFMRKIFTLLPVILIVSFFPLSAAALPPEVIVCAPGNVFDAPDGWLSPALAVPTFDYTAEGYARFHFQIRPGVWQLTGSVGNLVYEHRNLDCSNHTYTTATFSYGASLPDVPNLIAQAVESSPGSGSCRFVGINADTGQVVSNFGNTPPDFDCNTVVDMSFYSCGYYANPSGTNCSGVTTPAVPAKITVSAKPPVLIVPGIMGTQIFKGTELLWPDVVKMLSPFSSDDFMDPLAFKNDGTPLDTSLSKGEAITEAGTLNYTKKLREDLVSSGYTEGVDLFTFPYDWREDIHKIATENLKGQIDYILNQTSAGQAVGKVDIIAHSQGGLVIKRLLKELPEYQSKVKKLVFVGVPNLGAPKAAKVLLYGDSMDISFAGMGLNPEEVKKISQNMPSVYELLPSDGYFNYVNGYLGKAEPVSPSLPILHVATLNSTSTTQYLKGQNLNSSLIDSAALFHDTGYDNFDFSTAGIDTYNIVGCQAGTMGKILIKPDGNFQIMPTAGDGTVPVFSANNIPGATTFFALESSHASMLTQDGARQQIIGIITETAPDTGGKITPNLSDCRFDGTWVSSHSPVDLHIYDGLGHHAGPKQDGGFDAEIPNVGYDILGYESFAFLPAGGQYTVKLIATGSGSFSFDSSAIWGGEITGTAHYDSIPITASSTAEVILNAQNNQSIQLDINGDGVIDQAFPPSSLLNAEQSQDTTPPVSTSTLTGLMGSPGFYHSAVEISLSAEDPVIEGQENQTSGALKLLYNLDHQGWAACSPPPSPSRRLRGGNCGAVVVAEGPHTLELYSVDRAGNREPLQAVSFSIDLTPPEFTVSFSPTTNSYIFQGIDDQSGMLTPQCLERQCTVSDEAGNTSKITFQRKRAGNQRLLSLKTLKYNHQTSVLPDNLLRVNTISHEGVLKSFSQMALLKAKEIVRIEYIKHTDLSRITKYHFPPPPTRYTLPGVHYLEFETNNNSLKVNVK